jgi:serine/threonine-protein kinase RsbW
VVWLTGDIRTGDDQVVDDGRIDASFSFMEWVNEIRSGYPDSVLAATFPPHLPDDDDRRDGRSEGKWLEWTLAAAGVDLTGGERSFTGDTTPTSLHSLRRWALGRLEGRGYPVDDIVLAVSELATNVERHGGTWLTVDLVERADAMVLAVTDPARDSLPEAREVTPEDEEGRGLLVVASLALGWGVVVRTAHKTVWAAFPSCR